MVIHPLKSLMVLLLIAGVLFIGSDVNADTVEVTTNMDAVTAYEDGFAYDVMRASDGKGIMLNDMVLLEDDGPGSGNSEKGTWNEELYQGLLARKTIELDDAAAYDAHVVLYMVPLNKDRTKQEPFFLFFNDERFEGPPLSSHENMWHWVRIPVRLLKKGENSIVIGCDAPKGEGYNLMVARADEYEAGGGKYITDGNTSLASAGQIDFEMDEKSGSIRIITIGKNSSKSTDGGKSWKRMKIGSTDDVLGEYTVRLNVQRYKPQGKLLSAPIDLWSGILGMEKIKPACAVDNLKLFFLGDTPQGTSITWQVRSSDTPNMTDASWSDFQTMGKGETASVDIENGKYKRYIQWQAILETSKSLSTPVVQSVTIKRTLTYTPPVNKYYIWEYDNVTHHYPSVTFTYEKWDEPKLKVLRDRLKLDEVIAGASSDWDIINRVRHLVSEQWHHGSPLPDYPEWNALDILDRRDRMGRGGMCIQFSVVMIQCLESLGYQARHINIFAHETVEVYVDELGKWVHVDPESVFDSYEYMTENGVPVNGLEQHKYFLIENGFSAKRPIDWQATAPWSVWGGGGKVRGIPVPLDFSTATGWINDPSKPDYPPQHRLTGFMRMMPRNDYFSRPYPRPLSQGSSNWPWNGYLNWYDAATPRKLQYSMHSDREADFYPTLNRVQFDAVRQEKEDEILISMITFAPNFGGFEINIDGTGWRESPSHFIWKLNKSALNTVQMRAKNKLGPKGMPSKLQVMYHYKEPFQARPANW